MNLLNEAWIPVRRCICRKHSPVRGFWIREKSDRAVSPPGQLPTDVGNNPH